jgi:flagellar P-ring protein precursor FlgI
MKRITCLFGMMLLATAATLASPMAAVAGMRLEDICRIKGQEENTLHGLGIVVGLKGTGDGGDFAPMVRSLAMAMQLMGNPIGQGELRNAKNCALVTVSATIPAEGARQGDQIDCQVSSIGSAKSLAGGRLFTAPLQGPNPESDRVYAFAEGAIVLDDQFNPLNGTIKNGCRLEEEFFNVFSKGDRITLVIDRNLAGFQVAQEIAFTLQDQLKFQLQSEPGKEVQVARAINQGNVEVLIPPAYREDPVDWIAQVLAVEIRDAPVDARVVINQKTNAIAVDGDVEIGAALVAVEGITVQAGFPNLPSPFAAVGPKTAKLDDLIKALNAVKVPPAEIIQIIRVLDRSGNIKGQVIFE